jgi:hypothetical protein
MNSETLGFAGLGNLSSDPARIDTALVLAGELNVPRGAVSYVSSAGL